MILHIFFILLTRVEGWKMLQINPYEKFWNISIFLPSLSDVFELQDVLTCLLWRRSRTCRFFPHFLFILHTIINLRRGFQIKVRLLNSFIIWICFLKAVFIIHGRFWLETREFLHVAAMNILLLEHIFEEVVLDQGGKLDRIICWPMILPFQRAVLK